MGLVSVTLENPMFNPVAGIDAQLRRAPSSQFQDAANGTARRDRNLRVRHGIARDGQDAAILGDEDNIQ